MKKHILIILINDEVESEVQIEYLEIVKVSPHIKDDDVDTILSYLIHDAQRYVEHATLSELTTTKEAEDGS